VAALIAGYETSAAWMGRVWTAMALAPFIFGWWRRLADFRIQGYALAALGAAATALAVPMPEWGLAFSAAAAYAAVLCAVRSGPERFSDTERDALRLGGSVATTLTLAALVWRLTPGHYLGLAWMALALPVLELGLRSLPSEFRSQAYALAAAGAFRILYFNLPPLDPGQSVELRLVPLGAAAIAYGIALRAADEWVGRVFDVASFTATGFLLPATWALLPGWVVAPVWAVIGLSLMGATLLRGRPTASLRWQSYAVAALAFVRCWASDFGTPQAIPAVALVIACLYGAQLLSQRGSRPRLYFSLLATLLLAGLLFDRVSGSLLTVAWGLEGLALLAAGFPLRDRVQRFSGLTLLLGCILKLFLWDLRHLDTLPRILSFIVLGLLLVAVSWIYTRFRDRVQRYF
jgi:uncharacterized membrane protein